MKNIIAIAIVLLSASAALAETADEKLQRLSTETPAELRQRMEALTREHFEKAGKWQREMKQLDEEWAAGTISAEDHGCAQREV
jgi:hypothetical protein